MTSKSETFFTDRYQYSRDDARCLIDAIYGGLTTPELVHEFTDISDIALEIECAKPVIKLHNNIILQQIQRTNQKQSNPSPSGLILNKK